MVGDRRTGCGSLDVRLGALRSEVGCGRPHKPECVKALTGVEQVSDPRPQEVMAFEPANLLHLELSPPEPPSNARSCRRASLRSPDPKEGEIDVTGQPAVIVSVSQDEQFIDQLHVAPISTGRRGQGLA